MVVVSVYYVECAVASTVVSVECTSIRLPLSQADPIKLLVPNCGHVPSSLEMEEFFAAAEQQQHQAIRESKTYKTCSII
ncbi:hypothetical protein E2562_002882 [Oryza meyeriana var. granulata]|uniref:Uncharacterized protein n=1 Tax=Oryza meyeriana var. granulata TaxID=110450 RepID=A0A6G1DD48_9ORYZ|nr:hypothetical protein E2562_002882 [Oryza meyeriana var. granulata]